MPEPYREPVSGESIREYLHDMLSDVVRNVTGSGVMQAGGAVNIRHPFGSTASQSSFLARLTASRRAFVPVEMIGYNEHPYRFVYGFQEVTLLEQCFDKATGEDIGCGDNTLRYIKVVDLEGGRSGDPAWPESAAGANKWAVNVWELLHKLDNDVEPEEQHYVYGANIKQNQYPPSFAPVGPGQGDVEGPEGDLHADNQDLVVVMREMFDAKGQAIRYFTAPGIHAGTCAG